jgi:predicted membrane metal-binding protein
MPGCAGLVARAVILNTRADHGTAIHVISVTGPLHLVAIFGTHVPVTCEE